MIEDKIETESILSRVDKDRVMSLYSQEEIEDPLVSYIFTCMNSFWVMTEANFTRGVGFGYCQMFEGGGELGYFNFDELEHINQLYGVNVFKVEGDTLSSVLKKLKS